MSLRVGRLGVGSHLDTVVMKYTVVIRGVIKKIGKTYRHRLSDVNGDNLQERHARNVCMGI